MVNATWWQQRGASVDGTDAGGGHGPLAVGYVTFGLPNDPLAQWMFDL
jgi:hypothetical protein